MNPQNFNAVQIINELEGREINVDTILLDKYVGKYQYRPNVIWIIARDGNKLTFQEKGQNVYKLEAISNTQFVIPRANVSISFEKDSDGEITELIFNQGGRLLKAKKLASNQTNKTSEKADFFSYKETELPKDTTKLLAQQWKPKKRHGDNFFLKEVQTIL